jgi:uncharacterized CHY-type Zn-finger protein
MNNPMHCPNCLKLFGNDVNGSLEVDFSSNLLSLVRKTKYAPGIALEIKCVRCKVFYTCYGGEYHAISIQELGLSSS